MIVSYDTEVGSTYLALRDDPVVRTVSVSDLVMVDLDEHDEPVGVEFAIGLDRITVEMLERLGERFPTLKGLRNVETWLFASCS